VQWTQVPGGMTNPVGQRRAIEIDALPRVDLRLAIQQMMVSVFGDKSLSTVASAGNRHRSAGRVLRPAARLRRRHRLAGLVHAPPVQTFQQRGQLRRRQSHDTVLDLRPTEDTVLEQLGEQA
jgi:hypothetical protein